MIYGPDLHAEVLRYAEEAARIAARESFDVIHAHDWMTFMAGMRAKRASGKPLVLHVHATEFDRSGGGENGFVTAIERAGAAAADRVVAVSGYTADVLATRYGVPRERLRVVHNAIDPREPDARFTIGEEDPLVLFAGRITWQKGPDYFVDAAERVAAEMPRRQVRRRGLRRPDAGHDAAGRRARARGAFPVHRVPASGRSRSALCAGRRLRHAVRVRAVRPDGPRGPAARHAGHRVALRGRLRGGPERAPRPFRRRRGPRLEDPRRSSSFRRCATRSRRAAARTCGGSRGGSRRGDA